MVLGVDSYLMDLAELTDFFEKKGTLEIFVEVGAGSRTFNNIEDAVLASSTTVSKRLQEARELNLIEIIYKSTDHGSQKRHALTRAGREIYLWAEELGIVETVKRRQRIERKYRSDRELWINKIIHSEPVQLAAMQKDDDISGPELADGEESAEPLFSADEARRARLESALVDSYKERDKPDKNGDEDPDT